ncbi:MAG: hypothetical protein CM15mP75_0020 [Flammeovirgaceae bacterium]|nr:MAG: hypothetical protein CM15mP75_0020 [Flammeovirgaceae bacterium]
MVPGFEVRHRALQCEKLPELRGIVLWKDEAAPRHGFPQSLWAGEANLQALDRRLQVGTEDPVIIIYTSGTTGISQKGPCIVIASFWKAATSPKRCIWKPETTCFVTCPLSCAGSVATVMPAMQHGATIVTMDQWEPAAAIDLIERERINIMGGIPTHFIDAGVPASRTAIRIA